MYELEDPNEKSEFYTTDSDRAAGVVWAAILENRLTDLLKTAMRKDAAISKELMNKSGALAAFGVKASVAYMFHLIHADVHRDIGLVIKIRNEFAHTVGVVSFNDPKIKSRVAELKAFQIHKKMYEEAKKRINHDSSLEERVKLDILSDAVSDTRSGFRLSLEYLLYKIVSYEKEIRTAFEPSS